jgi:nicotinate phosphoribosyltransferase
MAFAREIDAFRQFANDYPDRAILLIDTYDTTEGARRAVAVANELAPEGIRLQAVRLDSGDLGVLSQAVRQILDKASLGEVKIFASGDLDEYRIGELLGAGAPINAFGVGTQLGTSGDAPALGGVYKLVADDRGPKIKLSTGKVTLPGRKQVYRHHDRGHCASDLIALQQEEADGEPLLARVMADGRRTGPKEPLKSLQERCKAALAGLPEPLRSLTRRHEYPVRQSKQLEALVRAMNRRGRTASRGDLADMRSYE